ncbi:hypothetical protein ALP16_102810 [Pseudomonas savastanoi]|uniref:Uncharacterized protein n=1 Tax=Pseudomonas savastanoi TaxID=29438 RepID=A0A3M5ZWJ8_PSESS|nr:hypothetical protein ALO74_102726 [Pseudomonas syringae pv. cunninghamiae]RMV06864.1 hypothetical protein ALP17_111062 [Pseudomonas savastanoi]RMV11026.1 hypothetical protein ALP16_102810 [Pseudomonas savastanoi]
MVLLLMFHGVTFFFREILNSFVFMIRMLSVWSFRVVYYATT